MDTLRSDLRNSYQHYFNERRFQFPRETEYEYNYWTCYTFLTYYYKPKKGLDKETLHACETVARKSVECGRLMKRKFMREIGLLPSSFGYDCLVGILEMTGRFEEGVAVAEEAISEGWGGRRWEAAIKRMQKKLTKQTP